MIQVTLHDPVKQINLFRAVLCGRDKCCDRNVLYPAVMKLQFELY